MEPTLGLVRIQRRRAKGWRLPEGVVCVDRSTKWGNPFVAGHPMYHRDAVRLHLLLLQGYICVSANLKPGVQEAYQATVRRDIGELRGKSLACWCRLCDAHKAGLPLGVTCPDCSPCHADTLLQLAARRGLCMSGRLDARVLTFFTRLRGGDKLPPREFELYVLFRRGDAEARALIRDFVELPGVSTDGLLILGAAVTYLENRTRYASQGWVADFLREDRKS